MTDTLVRVPVKEKQFVGLDLSFTGTGFCLLTGDKTKIETIKTKPDGFKDDLSRLKFIAAEVVRRIPPSTSLVCLEDFYIAFSSKQIGSSIRLAMLATAVRLALYETGIPFAIVAPTTLKKFILGKGVGQKDLIVREVYKKFGIEVLDDDQADAVVLSHIAKAILDNSLAVTKPQKEAIDKIIKDGKRYNM